MEKRFGIWMLLVLAGGCSSTSSGPEYKRQSQEFGIYVDSVAVPDAIAPDESLTVYFHAIVGPDLCYAFDRFEIEERNHDTEVSLVGRHHLSGECATAISQLQGKRLALRGRSSGPIQLIVRQPNNDLLAYSIDVVPTSR